jgi:hypothetical protein
VKEFSLVTNEFVVTLVDVKSPASAGVADVVTTYNGRKKSANVASVVVRFVSVFVTADTPINDEVCVVSTLAVVSVTVR